MRGVEDKVMVSFVYGKDTDISGTGIKVGDFEAKSERDLQKQTARVQLRCPRQYLSSVQGCIAR